VDEFVVAGVDADVGVAVIEENQVPGPRLGPLDGGPHAESVSREERGRFTPYCL
jgi:hypothetical protein